MNILKRPMFFAALTCSLAAAISLFVKMPAIAVLLLAIILLSIAIINKKYKYITVLFAVLLFCVSLLIQFVKIEQINIYDGEELDGTFLVIEETTDHGTFNSITLKEINCNTLPQNTKLLVFDYNKSALKMGDIVNVTLKLSAINRYNEYRLSNYSNGIYAIANVVQLEKMVTITVFTKWQVVYALM